MKISDKESLPVSAGKHTPGPWISVGAWVEHPDDDVADICSCDPATINQEHLGRGDSEICANARLIAAAPDMLDALQFVTSASRILPEAMLKVAKDAIAKALGEKQ